MFIVTFCAGASVLVRLHGILFPLELAMGGWVGSFSKEEPPTSAGKRSSRCSRKDLTGICACPLRGVKDDIEGKEEQMQQEDLTGNCACPPRGVKNDIGEEKQQMQQEGSHWELCLSPERGEE